MKNTIRSAAVAAALTTTAASAQEAAQFPFAAAEPAERVFAGTVPATSDLSLGMSYGDAEAVLRGLGDGWKVQTADRSLEFGNSRTGKVEFAFPEILHVETTNAGAPTREEVTATFSSPLTGSQLLKIDRRIHGRNGEELSIADTMTAIRRAWGEPTGGWDENTPRFAYAWVDGKLLAAGDVQNLKADNSAVMARDVLSKVKLTDIEKRTDAFGELMSYVNNDPLVDVVNELVEGKQMPSGCTALATVWFLTGSRDDLAGSVLVTVAYTDAILTDAKAVLAAMSAAAESGSQRRQGVAPAKF